MHKSSERIRTDKGQFFIDNKTGKRGFFIGATLKEYQTRTNKNQEIYITIKGKRHYFVKADGCPLFDFDFDLSYCN